MTGGQLKWSEDPERQRQYYKQYHEEHRERILVQNKERYEKNKELHLARMKKWHDAHKEEVAIYHKKWQHANPDKRRAIRFRYNEANRENVNAKSRRWNAEHQWLRKLYTQKYRARKRGNGGSFTLNDLNKLFVEQDGRCFYCDKILVDTHIEHRIPLSRGGTNYIENIALSCAKCNLSKGTMTDKEFLERRESI
jgi:5-methylcytosine-specific restriction endonuclease McrA